MDVSDNGEKTGAADDGTAWAGAAAIPGQFKSQVVANTFWAFATVAKGENPGSDSGISQLCL